MEPARGKVKLGHPMEQVAPTGLRESQKLEQAQPHGKGRRDGTRDVGRKARAHAEPPRLHNTPALVIPPIITTNTPAPSLHSSPGCRQSQQSQQEANPVQRTANTATRHPCQRAREPGSYWSHFMSSSSGLLVSFARLTTLTGIAPYSQLGTTTRSTSTGPAASDSLQAAAPGVPCPWSQLLSLLSSIVPRPLSRLTRTPSPPAPSFSLIHMPSY